MKELSIEQKAKRYDEAIEKLRSLHDDYDTVSTLIDIKEELENIFPELKESEDDRMKKLCISVVKQFAAVCRKEDKYLTEVEKCIAWLEKQGEQKPKFRVGDTIKCKHDDRIFTIKSVDLDKGKYTYTQEGCGNDIDYADEMFELVEQKSAWSEEDEKILSDIIKDLVHPWNEYIPDRIEDEIKWLKNRLKSLKDKVQPHREWNEEDKEQLDRALYMMEQLDMTKSWDDVYNWLKSLKARFGCEVNCTTTWKPSELDILLLERIAYGKSNPQDCQASLGYLIEQLKKLREE